MESDIKVHLSVVTTGAYGSGKQIVRMVQLVHIAEVANAANVREVDALVDRIKNTKNSNSSQVADNPTLSSSLTSVFSSDTTYSTTRSGTT